MSTNSPRSQSTEIFIVSVASLFIELLLIRWIGTEVRIFAYLQNTILVVCFLGLGVGCWTCRQPVKLGDILLPLLVLFGVLVPISWFSLGNQLSLLLNSFGDILLFTETVTTSPLQTVSYLLLGLVFTFVLLALVWDLFLPFGRLLGRLLVDHPHTIAAYSWNVGGSLVGVWLFVALSASHLPPAAWAAAVAALLFALAPRLGPVRRRDALGVAALVPLAALAGWEPGAVEVTWSPYQKLALKAVPAGRNPIEAYDISVNSSGGFQTMLDYRPEAVAAHPERYPAATRGGTQYDLPAVLHPAPRKVLILGAGSGNGTAAALRNGVGHVTAVDIDPVIIDYGRRFHPERPYLAPNVTVVCDDARAFLANAAEKYDVIAYEFLDAHATTSMTNTRLDHYVYTRESFARARELLADGGLVVVRFGYERPFIVDRMARVLGEVFAAPPLVFGVQSPVAGLDGLIMVAGDTAAARRQVAARPALAEQVAAWEAAPPLALSGTTPITTDDWPYLYLERPQIPPLYLTLGGLLVLLFVRGARNLPPGSLPRPAGTLPWHFFLLGAAFMLLETQNVSKAAVALGSTWLVNAVIISAVLVLILLANLLAAAWPSLPLTPVYVLLCAACVGLYFVDVSRFAGLPFAHRALVVGALTSLPMLFSGVVFIRSFAAAPDKGACLGYNLLGALAGGLTQSVTFVTGIQALLLVVGALYLGAFLTAPRGRRAGGGPPAADASAAGAAQI
ncbi:spermidine synthase [Gemmata sp.]|uniref:spermidine synthase n=1 Tax=Gemmata sp. TaxID=1914242 RepID=UPI003F6FD54C